MAGGRSVAFENVSKRFLVRGSPLAVLDDISLDCRAGLLHGADRPVRLRQVDPPAHRPWS